MHVSTFTTRSVLLALLAAASVSAYEPQPPAPGYQSSGAVTPAPNPALNNVAAPTGFATSTVPAGGRHGITEDFDSAISGVKGEINIVENVQVHIRKLRVDLTTCADQVPMNIQAEISRLPPSITDSEELPTTVKDQIENLHNICLPAVTLPESIKNDVNDLYGCLNKETSPTDVGNTIVNRLPIPQEDKDCLNSVPPALAGQIKTLPEECEEDSTRIPRHIRERCSELPEGVQQHMKDLCTSPILPTLPHDLQFQIKVIGNTVDVNVPKGEMHTLENQDDERDNGHDEDEDDDN